MYFYIVLAAFALFNAIDISFSADPHWDYGELGPDVWKDFYPTCGSTAQSPINIKTGCTTYQSYPSFQFSSAYNLTQDFLLTNNGHTVVGEQINATAFPLTLSGGGLNETFTFKNFHLHWGENYNSGSEHQLNGEKYSGEVHFVHANAAGTQYAVLGIFLRGTPPENLTESVPSEHQRRKRRIKRDIRNNTNNATIIEWDGYFAVSDDLSDTNDTSAIKLTLLTLMGTNLNNFYRYFGSLTVPPCTENVIWTVFQTSLQFNKPTFDGLRSKLYFEDYRGPQPTYGRTVYRSFPNATLSSIPDYTCCEQIEVINTKAVELTNRNSILLMNRQLFICSFLLLSSYFFSFNLLI